VIGFVNLAEVTFVALVPRRGLTVALNHLEAPPAPPLVPIQRVSQLPAKYQRLELSSWGKAK
jgi:hypothetical protein